jgi:hypothetical protein
MLGHGSNPAHGDSDTKERNDAKRRGFRPSISGSASIEKGGRICYLLSVMSYFNRALGEIEASIRTVRKVHMVRKDRRVRSRQDRRLGANTYACDESSALRVLWCDATVFGSCGFWRHSSLNR